MGKEEAKAALHQLFSQWGKTITSEERQHPSFLTFKSWLQENGYSHYISFRSVRGAEADAEDWFDNYFGQAHRR